jgi:beta-galactosidase
LANPVSETNLSRFGLRKIEVDNRNYTLKLNGESVRPMGFNLVPDDRTTGNTLPLWRIKEDIDLLKSLGCNMTRLSHLVLPEEMMDYLDERGMLVVSEIPLWGFDPLADPENPMPKDWLNRMIARQYNHPCVMAWSVGNEIGDFPTTMKYVEAATAYVRTLDSTRLAAAVSHTADRSPDFIQFSDIGLINKYNKNLGPVTDLQHKLHPGKVLFYSEYGIGQIGENLDATLNAKSLLDSLRGRPYLIGGSLWTFNDYRSSFFGTKEFSENRPWGVVDVFRRKKQAWFAFRKEQSPVREMTVNVRPPASATVTILPRTVLDLPAFPLRGYRLVWKVCDANGAIRQGGFEPLPTVRPGEAAFTKSFQWTATNPFALKVELHTPQSEAVFDTTVFFQKPVSAKILQVVGARSNQNGNRGKTGMLRVYFEHSPTATAYKIRYGTGEPTQETKASIENFIDVPGLTFGQTYQVALVSVNGAGETLSEVQTATIEDKLMAPPAIRHVEPADGGFFVGYATEDDDFLFRVQYTTQSGEYAKAPIIQSTTPGVLFVPDLKNGQPYYFRVQRFKDNNAESLWTSERTVTPDGDQRLPPPVLQGVLRRKKEALVCFEPVKKATGYVIEYRTDSGKEWTRFTLNTAQIGHAKLLLPESDKKYQFRIASANDGGLSEFSEIVVR